MGLFTAGHHEQSIGCLHVLDGICSLVRTEHCLLVCVSLDSDPADRSMMLQHYSRLMWEALSSARLYIKMPASKSGKRLCSNVTRYRSISAEADHLSQASASRYARSCRTRASCLATYAANCPGPTLLLSRVAVNVARFRAQAEPSTAGRNQYLQARAACS